MSTLTIYHIVARERDGGDAVWIEDSWDEWTRDENPGGFDESLAKIRDAHGGENVRVVEVRIPEDTFHRAFDNITTDGVVSSD